MNLPPPNTSHPALKQRGFTLFELVAVMALLAILTALAVPRYFRSRDQAARMAASAAVAEGRARVAQFAAVYIAGNDVWPASSDFSAAALGTDAGDFSLSYSFAGDTITIRALGLPAGPAAGAMASGTLPRPGSTY